MNNTKTKKSNSHLLLLTSLTCLISFLPSLSLSLSLSLSFSSSSSYSQSLSQPLPKWETQEEIRARNLPSKASLRRDYNRDLPPSSFRLPAEYEPVQAVVLGFSNYSKILSEIQKNALEYGDAQVWSAKRRPFLSDSSLITENIQENIQEGIQENNQEKNQGVDQVIFNNNLLKQILCPINTSWIRDYGPIGMIDDTKQLAVIDTLYYPRRRQDDAFPNCFAKQLSLTSYDMDLFIEGGNILVDSSGNLFTTKRVYLANPTKSHQEIKDLLKLYFNVHTVHIFDYHGYPGSYKDGTGHIDMIVKLIDDETVFIAYDPLVNSEYNLFLEKIASYFKDLKTPQGGKYNIVRVPATYHRTFSSRHTLYSYVNSLIINDLILIPSFKRFPSLNQEALEIYKRFGKGRKIISINSDASITSAGSLHCLTQLVPRTSSK